MPRYSDERREAVLAKLLPPHSLTVKEVAQRAPSGGHVFDKLCAEAGIEHRLTPLRRPQTKGMVERFNGRISGVLPSHRFDSREALETTLKPYCHPYNCHIPQRALNYRIPIQAMKDWQVTHPHLFIW